MRQSTSKLAKQHHDGAEPSRHRLFHNVSSFAARFALCVLAALVPLVVFLKVLPVPAEYQKYWITPQVFDFFAYYKAQIVMWCAAFVALITLTTLISKSFKRSASGAPALLQRPDSFILLLSAYVAMTVVSTVRSADPAIAYWGYFERWEGLWLLLAYAALLITANLWVRSAKQAWQILGAGSVAIVGVSLVGAMQFVDHNPFSTSIGRWLILPSEYLPYAAQMKFNFPPRTVYSTLYNSNNVAAMMAMAFPIAAVCGLLLPDRRVKLAAGAVAVLAAFALVSSGGRGGWMGACGAFLFLIILSPAIRSKLMSWKLGVAVLLLAGAVGFAVINHVGHQALSARMTAMVAGVSERLVPKAGSDNCPGIPRSAQAKESLADELIRRYGGLGSHRAYIWIRSIEIAGHTFFVGRGPDTFALHFPNGDAFKACTIGSEVFVDKTHNLYLQMWLNQGGIATLAFLGMIIVHTVRTRKALRLLERRSDLSILILALFGGWAGYLVAGLFYDSTVTVAPVFWIVFGLGVAANHAANGAASRVGDGAAVDSSANGREVAVKEAASASSAARKRKPPRRRR